MSSNVRTISKSGQTLYLEWIDHLTRLERGLERLKRVRTSGPRIEKLDELKSILIEVASFLQTQSDSELMETISKDVARLHEKIGQLRKLLAGRSWHALKSMLGAVDANGFEIKITYDEVRADFMRIVMQHLISCVKPLDVENSQKHAFLESIDAFSTELERVW